MPRDLFGDVQRPSVRVGSSSRYTVPLSLAAHVAAILAVVGGTLLGPVVLPGLASADLSTTRSCFRPRRRRRHRVRRRASRRRRRSTRTRHQPWHPKALRRSRRSRPIPGLRRISGRGFVPGITNLDTIVGEPPLSAPAVPAGPGAARSRGPAAGQGPRRRADLPGDAQQAHVPGHRDHRSHHRCRWARPAPRASCDRSPLLDEAALAAVRQWDVHAHVAEWHTRGGHHDRNGDVPTPLHRDEEVRHAAHASFAPRPR